MFKFVNETLPDLNLLFEVMEVDSRSLLFEVVEVDSRSFFFEKDHYRCRHLVQEVELQMSTSNSHVLNIVNFSQSTTLWSFVKSSIIEFREIFNN